MKEVRMELCTKPRECGDLSVAAGRAPTQMGWYQFATQFVASKQVLDVGCGLGDGITILARHAATVHGQDIDERLAGSNVFIVDLSRIADKSYDVVIAIDVIEHVPAPIEFLENCFRIARQGVFVSTPNWTASRCKWPYHLREYTPAQFVRLLRKFGTVTLFKGNCCGCVAYRVKHPTSYSWLNSLRNNALTGFSARCMNYLLPSSAKIAGTNAAYVALSEDHG